MADPVLTPAQVAANTASAAAAQLAADQRAALQPGLVGNPQQPYVAPIAFDKAAVFARHDEDMSLLRKSGNWKPVKDEEDTWVNKKMFVGFNEFGRTQSVPMEVTRNTAEAAKLERMRPLPK